MPYIVHIRSPSFETVGLFYYFFKKIFKIFFWIFKFFFLQLKERQRAQLDQGLIDVADERSDGDFRRTVVESERLEKDYAHYFDSRIVNNDFGETFNTLVRNQFFS